MFGEYPVVKIIYQLETDNLLPAILFRTARKQCDQDLDKIAYEHDLMLPKQKTLDLRQAVTDIAKHYRIDQDIFESNPQFEILMRFGVGAHHAGQLLLWRLLLEELMTKGLLRLMIATGTVAAGVDFPARTAVVTAHSRRSGQGFQLVTSSEFQQMAGRAGRRGKDTIGFCLVAPSLYSDARVIFDIARKPPEPLRSAYFASPATVLNLMKYRTVDDLRYTVQKSLASFLDSKHATQMEKTVSEMEEELNSSDATGAQKKSTEKRIRREKSRADKLRIQQQQLLELTLYGLDHLGYVKDGGLTEKGTWAAELCSSLVLELSEAVAEHVFTDLKLEDLIGLIASIAGDSYRPYLTIAKNNIPKELFKSMETIVNRIQQVYQGAPFLGEIAVNPAAASTVLSWVSADSWETYSGLLRLGGVSEGDAARLISQTADQLNQIGRLTESHPALAKAAKEARELLMRPPITEVGGVDLI